MKKNKNGKRYFELKNCIAYFKAKKSKDWFYLLPSLSATSNLFKKTKAGCFFETKIISFCFLWFEIGLIFEDNRCVNIIDYI